MDDQSWLQMIFCLSVNIVHSVSQCQWCIGTMWINTDCTRPGVHHRAWADNQHRLHQVSCRMTKRQRWGWSTMHLLLLWVGHPSGCHYLSLLMTSWPSLPCSPSQVALTSRRSFLSDHMDFFLHLSDLRKFAVANLHSNCSLSTPVQQLSGGPCSSGMVPIILENISVQLPGVRPVLWVLRVYIPKICYQV